MSIPEHWSPEKKAAAEAYILSIQPQIRGIAAMMQEYVPKKLQPILDRLAAVEANQQAVLGVLNSLAERLSKLERKP